MVKSSGNESCCYFKGLKLGSTDLHQNAFAMLKSCCFFLHRPFEGVKIIYTNNSELE